MHLEGKACVDDWNFGRDASDYEGEPPTSLPPELWSYRVDRNRVIVGGALSDGGGLYQWLRETLLPNDDAESIERELFGMEPDSHGLTILPFWAGERSTGWNPDARGAFLGLTSQTRPIEICVRQWKLSLIDLR